MSEKIVVCLEKGGARDMAEAFSRRTNTGLSGGFRKYASPGDQRKITA